MLAGRVSTLTGSFITLGASGVMALAGYLWLKYMPRYQSWISGWLRSRGFPAGRGVSRSSQRFGGYFLFAAAAGMLVMAVTGLVSSL